jgi:hypothetical protein
VDLTSIILNMTELIQILEEKLTDDEIEVFLSSEWGVA